MSDHLPEHVQHDVAVLDLHREHLAGRHNGPEAMHSGCTACEAAWWYQHSVTLNTIAWRIATALGDVPEGADHIEGDPVEQTERLIAELEQLRAEVQRLTSELERAQPVLDAVQEWRTASMFEIAAKLNALCDAADAYEPISDSAAPAERTGGDGA